MSAWSRRRYRPWRLPQPSPPGRWSFWPLGLKRRHPQMRLRSSSRGSVGCGMSPFWCRRCCCPRPSAGLPPRHPRLMRFWPLATSALSRGPPPTLGWPPRPDARSPSRGSRRKRFCWGWRPHCACWGVCGHRRGRLPDCSTPIHPLSTPMALLTPCASSAKRLYRAISFGEASDSSRTPDLPSVPNWPSLMPLSDSRWGNPRQKPRLRRVERGAFPTASFWGWRYPPSVRILRTIAPR